MVSLGSKSSMASNALSAASSDMNVMNCMTMSDTHKLSTLNFIQNTKMRNLSAEWAKVLFREIKKEGDKEKMASIRMENRSGGRWLGGRVRWW